ncbi:hypothetical protein [Paenibacillus sp. GYB003]|uniref:hypothetical protein n=1 Tax=Paenibacillus sp. GYB003 TaxID=2994392 RepID=UPI002F96DC81
MKAVMRYFALLLTLAIAASGSGRALAEDSAAAAEEAKKVYEVTWTDEDLSTPMKWAGSTYFNNPQFKETRFENYNNGAPIPPGGTRETSFYMVYREDGVYLFLQSNEPETGADGKPLQSSLELFVAAGEGDIPYSQLIVPTSGTDIEYHEWQTEHRDHRPLKGSVRVESAAIPGAWGTLVVIPWEAVYDSIPLDGGYWQFNLIRWSPSDAQTWGGQVHQPGKFNLLRFRQPTPKQRMAIQKYLLGKAWSKFQSVSAELTEHWLQDPATRDIRFYTRHVLPLIAKGSVPGTQMHKLDRMDETETGSMYRNVPDWMELRYNVDDKRLIYVKKMLMAESID